MATQPLPLEGVKVLDFGTAIVGPLTGRILCDCGATVIKVETATHPDVCRVSTPQKDNVSGINRGGYFPPFNAGKMSMALNLTKPKGREIIHKLAPWADIVIETYTPRVMKNWGLDYAELSKVNPGLIMLSHCLQGQDGPRANMRGFGTQSAAMTGLFEVTGWEGQDPVGPFAAYPDWIAYHFTVTTLLAALEYRRRTGKGQYIDQAQVESTMHFLAQAFLDYSATGRIATRMGNHDLQMAPHGAFPCTGDDEWVAIAIQTDEEFQALCRVIRRPELARDARYATAKPRKANERDLEPLIEAWSRQQDSRGAMRILQEAGVPAGYVAKAQHLFDDPQLVHRRGFVELEHPEIGRHHVHTLGFKLSDTELVPRGPAPLMGQHNDHILREILGLSDAEIEAYRKEGIFE
jgi:benzylsuccinate CoA-transferase BbsF subunit